MLYAVCPLCKTLFLGVGGAKFIHECDDGIRDQYKRERVELTTHPARKVFVSGYASMSSLADLLKETAREIAYAAKEGG